MSYKVFAETFNVLVSYYNTVHSIRSSNRHEVRLILLSLSEHVLNRREGVGAEEHVVFCEEVEIGEA